MNSNANNQSDEDRTLLVDQIIIELEKDARKKDVIKRLCEQPAKFSWGNLLHHPAILLILGFTLTGCLGNILASKWQSREWNRQQLRLEQARKAEIKYAIIGELTKAITESEGAKKNLVKELITAFYYGQFIKDRDAEHAKRMASWRQAEQNWILAASTFEIRLKLYFNNPEIFSKLAELKQKKYLADGQIVERTYLYHERKEELYHDGKGRNFPQSLSEELDIGNREVEKLLKELVDLMVADIQKDSKESKE